MKAHQEVANAVWAGRLIRPDRCETCGHISGEAGKHTPRRATLAVIEVALDAPAEAA